MKCEQCGIPEHLKNHLICDLDKSALDKLTKWLPLLELSNYEKDTQLYSIFKDYKQQYNENISNNIAGILNKDAIKERVKSETHELKEEKSLLKEINKNLINDNSKLKSKYDILSNENQEIIDSRNKEIDSLIKSKEKSIKDTLNEKDDQINYFKVQLDKKDEDFKVQLNKNLELQKKIYESTIISSNSQKKGVTGENLTENMYVPDGWECITKSKSNHSGDHDFGNPESKNRLCVESKYYKTSVPSGEVDKLVRDIIDTESDGGIMISHTSNISIGNNYPINSIALENLGSKMILFIANANDIDQHIIKKLIITFDKFITLSNGDENCENIIKLKKKINNSVHDLKNKIDELTTLKSNFSSQKSSFDSYHHKNIKYTERLIEGVSETVSNMQKEIYLEDDQSQLNNILSKPKDSGFSPSEIGMMQDKCILNMNCETTNDNINERNSGDLNDMISEISSGSDEPNLTLITEDNDDGNNDDDEDGNNDDGGSIIMMMKKAGNNDDDDSDNNDDYDDEAGNNDDDESDNNDDEAGNNDGTENNDNNESYDVSVTDFIKEKINNYNPPTKQRNTIRSIRKYFIDCCKKENFTKMYEKFRLNNLKENEFKKIISDLGYEESQIYGKTYCGKKVDYRNTSYNINLPYPY